MVKTFIIKGTSEKEIDSKTATELMQRYSIVGVTYNKGQIIYLRSKTGNRIHSIIIVKE